MDPLTSSFCLLGAYPKASFIGCSLGPTLEGAVNTRYLFILSVLIDFAMFSPHLFLLWFPHKHELRSHKHGHAGDQIQFLLWLTGLAGQQCNTCMPSLTYLAGMFTFAVLFRSRTIIFHTLFTELSPGSDPRQQPAIVRLLIILVALAAHFWHESMRAANGV